MAREEFTENDKLICEYYFVKKDHERAFRLMYSTYAKKLYNHIRRIVISHDDADDVLQETLISVFKNFEHFRGDSQVYSWLYRVATNQALSFLREKARQKNVSLEDVSVQLAETLEEDPLFDADDKDRLLEEAILELPAKQRLVFNMKHVEKMKYSEISAILDTSEGALKASFHHAVNKIKSFIDKKNKTNGN